MKDIVKEEEISQIVKNIFADYEGGKIIDEADIFNKPKYKKPELGAIPKLD